MNRPTECEIWWHFSLYSTTRNRDNAQTHHTKLEIYFFNLLHLAWFGFYHGFRRRRADNGTRPLSTTVVHRCFVGFCSGISVTLEIAKLFYTYFDDNSYAAKNHSICARHCSIIHCGPWLLSFYWINGGSFRLPMAPAKVNGHENVINAIHIRVECEQFSTLLFIKSYVSAEKLWVLLQYLYLYVKIQYMNREAV